MRVLHRVVSYQRCQSIQSSHHAIEKINSIHWFCPVCDKKIMGLVSFLLLFAVKRGKEAMKVTQSVKLCTLTRTLRGLDVQKKIEAFEAVTRCLGPKKPAPKIPFTKYGQRKTNHWEKKSIVHSSSIIWNKNTVSSGISKRKFEPESLS